MPWVESAQQALARKARVVVPQPWTVDRWAGEPKFAEPEDGGLDRFFLSERFINASQALDRWHKLQLHEAEGRVIADISGPDAFNQLAETMRGRPDVTVWVPVSPQTCIAAMLRDPGALLESSKEGPPVKPAVDEPALPSYVRPVLEARATALEVQPPTPRIRERLVAPGWGASLAETGSAFLRPKPRRQLQWYAWSWPDGWTFP